MKNNSTILSDWAINKINTEYRDDVCLLLAHNALKLEIDIDTASFSYFIPATNRANGLARTFIIDDIGYDLFPIAWERIERMADVKDYNTTCLANANILWARSEEDKQRFISLQARLQANIQNPQHMHERAKSWFNTAKEIHQDNLFEEKLYKVRENAGHICDLLAIAVAFVNQHFFSHGQTNQLNELSGMKKLPDNFMQLYRGIIMEVSPEVQKQLCHTILCSVKAFLDAQEASTEPCAPDFTELAAWYHELSYTWRRVYHWCDNNDPVNAYLWCCMLQNEVEEWGTKFGIAQIDILGSFCGGDLTALRKKANEIEQKFVQAITESGARLDSYATVEDFLNSN